MSGAYQAQCIEILAYSAQSRAMNTSWKTISLAALGTLCVAVAADAQENPSASDRTLTVVVYDYAGLSDSSMNEVESLSTLLLSRAGIGPQWVHCLGHQTGPRPALCDGNLETGSVMIRILSSHPGQPNKLGDPLGWASVGNSYASLDASAIRKYAEHNGLPAGNLMAYAATHEIGHLLLGEKHAASGIMRAVWGKAEYREMAQRWLGFSTEERQALRQALPARDALVAGLK
jgi:hypothetical protein